MIHHCLKALNNSAAKVVADKGAAAWTSSTMQSVAALQHSSSVDSSRVGLGPEAAAGSRLLLGQALQSCVELLALRAAGASADGSNC